jgi:long-chain acyl-CoA synthetase
MSWTFAALIEVIESFGEAPALLSFDKGGIRSVSHAEVARQARSLASGLCVIGIAVQTPVALIGRNAIPWVVARLALGAAGAIAVAIDDAVPAIELGPLLAASRCKHVFCDAAHAAALRRAGAELDITIIGEDPAPEGTRLWRELFAPPRELPEIAPSAPAMLLFTSGTTGPAKRFFLSCEQLSANLQNLLDARLVGPGDHVLLPLPLHHIYPLTIGLLVPLLSGAAVVFPTGITGAEISRALGAADVSVVVGVPRLYAALASAVSTRAQASGRLRHTLFRSALWIARSLRKRFGVNAGRSLFRGLRRKIAPRLKLLVSGGARLDSDTLWFLAALGFDVRTGYGLAEAASVFTANVPGRERLGSEGKLLGAGELRIAAENGTGIGEIEVRGPSVFRGYEDNPEANREAFTKDGWLRTGDLGFLDADGFLFVTGRTRERIVLGGGKKIFPEELERHYGATALVRELAVLEHDGALVALVVPDLDESHRRNIARVDDAIRVHLASRGQELPPYRRLAGFRLSRTPLPRTRLGKFQRFRLPQLYAAAAGLMRIGGREPPADDPLLKDERARAVWDVLAARYPAARLGLDADLSLDLGIDSLEWISLGLVLEQRLGLELGADELSRIATVRDLLQAAVQRRTPEPASAPEWIPRARSPVEWLLIPPLYLLNWLLMRGLFRLRVYGLEQLPARGPFVLAANHASDLDVLALGAALGLSRIRHTYWAAAPSRLVAKPWMQPLLHVLQVFPVRQFAAEKSLEHARALLGAGKIVVWFPEAWRTPDGQLQRFRAGVGHLIVRAAVPAVPVRISGSFEAWPRHRRFPRWHRIEISIGKSIPAPAGEGDAQAVADALHDAIAALDAGSPPATAMRA